MKNTIYIILFALLSFTVHAEKYAVIVAVGDYPEASGWADISSVNDVELIEGALLHQGFSKQNIMTIINEQGTRDGIINALNSIKSKLAAGDILVVHFSMHGQQVFDDNGDELDSLDESLVPHNAFAAYSDSYQGENHLRDDDLGNIIKGLRNQLGTTGQLFMILDSCHSGSSTRGSISRGGKGALVPPNWSENKEVKNSGSDMMENVSLSDAAAPFVIISGARAKEQNFEYEGYGSLSYAFAKAMNTLGTDFTYRQLFNKITAVMATIAPKQQPVIEGDIDYKLFKGEYVQQQPFYTVKKVVNAKSISINAGTIQLFNPGTTVHILPAGTSKFDEKLSLAHGEVSRTLFNESRVLLDKELPDRIAQNYIVFVDQLSYGDISLNVFIDETVENQVKSGVETFLKDKNIGQLTTTATDAQVIVNTQNGYYILQGVAGGDPLNVDDKNPGAESIEELNENLFNYAQGSYLRNLEMKNPTYEFSFRLVPVEYDESFEEVGEVLEFSKFTDDSGAFQISDDGTRAVLEVTNHSNKDLYFSIVEIYNDGKILPFMPNANCDFTDGERLIPRKSTQVITGCAYEFAPPYERIVLKAFASTSPINLTPILTKKTTRAVMNPLESFVKDTYTQTRGGGGSRSNDRQLKGYTTEFVYEIIKK
ncbi:MAG: caspase family protein [Nonlabens sp.]|uniref:caspase family protein n=1 Tax=Nonlabens sp. TaxID=1888209 RepID=UPI003EF4E141